MLFGNALILSKTTQQIMTTDQKTERNKHADTIIRNHVVWAMGAGFIPVLIADIFAVSALQLDMIRQLCKAYDVDFQQTQGKAVVTSLTSSTLARVSAGSLVKLVPGLGSILGGVTISIFAGASTYALGEVFKKHFESGGTILDFDPARLKKMYQEKFEKGKKVAEDLARKTKEESQPEVSQKQAGTGQKTSSVLMDRLRDLNELRKEGIITEEEFEQMKKRLLESI
ncbi:MAG: DUF697 domain-containing protein [Saprospiraceae bacterium]|jgi:uncharacterized protein (DUF697 family)|nr:DUF697 domain-containing protein [Saprospiraceae bacterium]